MNQIMSLNTTQAREDPESEFASPQALRDEVGLTLGEKLAALERWAAIVERRLEAVGEGMQGADGEATGDAELLRQISLVIQELREELP